MADETKPNGDSGEQGTQAKKVDTPPKKLKKVRVRGPSLQQQLEEQQRIFNKDTMADKTEGDAALAAIVELIKQMGAEYRLSSGHDPDLSSTITLLDMLSDKKATISTATMPGMYRYYSASHPDPRQQGQKEPHFEGWGGAQNKAVEYKNPLLMPEWSSYPVISYVPTNQITVPEGVKIKPEAQLAERQPQWGIRVLTHNPQMPKGDTLPTSEIREFMWAVHEVRTPVKVSGKRTTSGSSQPSRASIRGGLQDEVLAVVKDMDGDISIKDALQPWLDELNDKIQNAINILREIYASDSNLIPNFGNLKAPDFIMIRRFPFPVEDPLNKYEWADKPSGNKTFVGCGKVLLNKAWEMVAVEYADYVYNQFFRFESQWLGYLTSQAGVGQAETVGKIKRDFITLVNVKKTNSYQDFSEIVTKKANTELITSPVFPVSDSKGYRVVGSFRYGRDVTIEPEGVFDVLHKQDPMAMLDVGLAREVLDDLIRNKTGSISSHLQQEVVEGLRQNMTDQQLIDIGLLTPDGDRDNAFKLNFMNWWAEKGRDGVHKMPVNNAAYSLADLAPMTRKSVCMCKAAEASVYLEAAGMVGFVEVSTPAVDVTDGAKSVATDNLTPWLQQDAERASHQWKLSQDALRGRVLDTEPTPLVSEALAMKDSFIATTNDLKDKANEVKSQWEAALDEFVTKKDG